MTYSTKSRFPVAALLAVLTAWGCATTSGESAGPQQPVPEFVVTSEGPATAPIGESEPVRARIHPAAYAHFSKAVSLHQQSLQAYMELKDILGAGNPKNLGREQLEAYQKRSAELWATAEMHLRQCLKLDPQADYVLAWWAENQFVRGQRLQALDTLRKLAKLDIEDFETAYRGAAIANQLGAETSDDVPMLVQRFYEKSLDTPDSRDRRQSLPVVYLQLDLIYSREGRYGDAIEMLEKLLAVPREHHAATIDNKRVYDRLQQPWVTWREIARHWLNLHHRRRAIALDLDAVHRMGSALGDAPGAFGFTGRLVGKIAETADRGAPAGQAARQAMLALEKSRRPEHVDDVQTALLEARILAALDRWDDVIALADRWMKKDADAAVLFKAARLEALVNQGRAVEAVRAMTPGDGVEANRHFDVLFGHVFPVMRRLDVSAAAVRDEIVVKHDKALEDPYVQFVLGMLAYVEEDYETAARQFARALDIRRTFFRSAYMLGQSYEQLKRYDEAVDVALGRSKIESDWRTALLSQLRRLPEVMARDGKPVEAAAAWARITQAGADYVEAVIFQDREIVRQLVKADPAASADRLLEAHPELAESSAGYNYLIGRLLARDARYNRAIDRLRAANRLADRAGLLWDLSLLELADALGKDNRHDEALKVLDTMPPGKVLHPQARRARVWILMEQKRFEQALVAARELVKAQPNDPSTHVLLGVVTMKKDGYPAATALLVEAARANGFEGIDIPRARASLALDAKDYDTAVEILEQLLDREDLDNDDTLRLREFLAHVLNERGDKVRAEALYRDNLAAHPDDPSANNSLSYFLAEQGRGLDEAERLVKRALEDEPKNYAFIDTLGWVYYRQGRYKEAVAQLEEAARLRPDAVILDHLGDAYRKVGRPDKALEAYHRAAEHDDAPDAVKTKIEELKKEARAND